MRSVLSTLFLLIILPTVFLLGTIGYVYLVRPSPDKELFTCTVKRPVLWPGEAAELCLHFNGDQLSAVPSPPSTTDVFLVIDRSGSMGDGPGSPLSHARSAATNFVSCLASPTFRVGVVAFNEEPNTVQAVSSDLDVVLQSIDTITCSGGTDITSALELAGQELQNVPPATPSVKQQAIILLSDGLDYSQSGVVDVAKELSAKGVDVFAIGLGYSIDEVLLRQVASNPRYYTRTLDPRQLASIYLEFGGALSDKIGYKGEIIEHVNTRLFQLPEEPSILLTQYDPDRGILQWSLPFIFPRPMTLRYKMTPRIAGVLNPACDPASLTYASLNHEVKTVKSGLHPRILALTWPLLLLLFLPAILYALYQLFRFLNLLFEPEPEVVKPVISPPTYSEPPVLTHLPKLPDLTLEPVPTLFVGIGNTGRWALTHVKYVLQELFCNKLPEEFQFLCLDTAKTEYEGKGRLCVQLDTVELLPNEIFCLPVGADLRNYVHGLSEGGRLPEYLRWFEAHRYRDFSADSLDLSKGSHGKRGLARLALIRDLEKGERKSGICDELKTKLERLFQSESSGREYQIFLVASATGGVGSGWFTDIAYLINRFAKDIAPDKSFSSYGILACYTPPGSFPQTLPNLYAICTELNRITFSGKFPTPMNYSAQKAGDDAFRGEIDGPLFDRICLFDESESIAAGEPPKRGIFAEIADSISLFCERSSLNGLKGHLQKLNSLESAERNQLKELTVSTAGIYTVRFPAGLLAERLKCRLLLHLFGGGMFLDLQEEQKHGSVTFRHATKDLASEILQGWREQAFLEQQCPSFFKKLREFYITNALPSVRDMVREIDHSAEKEAQLLEQGRHYGQYLQAALTYYLRGSDENGPNIWRDRCGRIGKAYHLFRILVGRTEAFESQISSQPLSKHDQDTEERLSDLAGLYLKINKEMLGELEHWAFVLIGPGAIDHPNVAKRPEKKGFYTLVAERYRQLNDFEEKVLRAMKSRWYLSDDEGEQALGEEGFFAEHIAPWVNGPKGLLARLWFEAVASTSDSQFAPALNLVFVGQERKIFQLDQDVPKELFHELGAICDCLSSRIRTSSIVDKLRGQSVPQAIIDPEIVSKKLISAQPALRISDESLQASGVSGPIRTQVFAQPDLQNTTYTKEVEKSIERHTTHRWTQLTCNISDIHSYLLSTMEDNFPISATFAFQKADEARTSDPKWGTEVEYIHEPEIKLRDYAQKFVKVSGHSAPRFHPLLGVVLTDPDRFRHFALLWILERIRSGQPDLVTHYVAVLSDSTEIPLTHGKNTPDLFDAALGFASIQLQDFMKIKDDLSNTDQDTIIEALDQTMRQLESDVVRVMPGSHDISLDKQVKLLIYTELSLEKERKH